MKYGKQVGFAAKAAALVAVVAGVATAGFDIRESKATLTAPTGKCGFLVSAKTSGFDAKYSASATTRTIASIGVFDFDAGKTNFIDTKVTNWGTSNAANSTVTGSFNFTVAATSTPGKFVVSATGDNLKLNVMSTNTANTYLIQQVADANNNISPFTGLCQAL